MSFAVERILDSKDRLGECPIWDEREGALWWVDIHAPAVKRYDGEVEAWPMPEPVGSKKWGQTPFFSSEPARRVSRMRTPLRRCAG